MVLATEVDVLEVSGGRVVQKRKIQIPEQRALSSAWWNNIPEPPPRTWFKKTKKPAHTKAGTAAKAKFGSLAEFQTALAVAFAEGDMAEA